MSVAFGTNLLISDKRSQYINRSISGCEDSGSIQAYIVFGKMKASFWRYLK